MIAVKAMSTTDTDPHNSVDPNVWHYHPKVPIPQGGIFRRIWDPVFVLKGILLSWFGLYVRGLALGLITVLWLTVLPSMDEIAAAGTLWIGQILLVNYALMLAWAGGLHLYLHRYAKQGRFLKFDTKPMRKGPQYTFGDQVYDNMFWTLAWSVPIWTAHECGLLWLLSQGMIPDNSWDQSALWFVLLFVLIPFVDSTHFYMTHRFLHWGRVYTHIHSVHHRNVNVGPWSGMSMHPIESAVFLSPVLIHLFLPSHPIHIVFHITWLSLGPATTHCGFAALSIGGKEYPRLGDFFHTLHHRFFECNYGNSEVPLDDHYGSFHDGSQAATERINQRFKALREAGTS